MRSQHALVTYTVVEIVALVAVLAFFLLVLTKMLKQVAGNLHNVACGVQSIEGHLTILAAVPMVNKTLDEIGAALPVVAQAAAAKAARR